MTLKKIKANRREYESASEPAGNFPPWFLPPVSFLDLPYNTL